MIFVNIVFIFQGLFPSCYSWLQAEVSYFQENNVITLVARALPSQEPPLSVTINHTTYFRLKTIIFCLKIDTIYFNNLFIT